MLNTRFVGGVTVQFEDGVIRTFNVRRDFTQEESGYRRISEEGSQFEALFIATDENRDCEIRFQATKDNGTWELYDPELLGEGRIIKDTIKVSSRKKHEYLH